MLIHCRACGKNKYVKEGSCSWLCVDCLLQAQSFQPQMEELAKKIESTGKIREERLEEMLDRSDKPPFKFASDSEFDWHTIEDYPEYDRWVLIRNSHGNYTCYMTDKEDGDFNFTKNPRAPKITHWKYIKPPKY